MNLPLQIAHKVNPHLFYGWVMLSVGFLGMLATGPGQSFTISIFVNPLIEELGLSRTMIASAYSVGTLVAALGLTYVGRLIDRFGARWMLAVLAFCLGLVCLFFPFVSGIVALSVAFTAVRFLGQGALTLGSTNLVSQWFSRRRGTALSINSLGFALGNALYPPLVQWSIHQVGWRMSWVILGICVMGVMIPLALILVVNKPEEAGMLPDGDGPESNKAKETADRRDLDEGFTLSEALQTVTFWVLAFSLAVPSMLVTGMIFHQISYFEEQGFTAQVAANIFPVLALSMVICMIIYGKLLDRYQAQHTVSGGIFTMAIAMWLLLMANTPFLANLYGVAVGMASAAMMLNSSYVWPRYFGRKHLGSIQGAGYTAMVVGAALGPLPFGMAYDWLGRYDEAVFWLSFLPAFCALVVFFTKPPPRDLIKKGNWVKV